MTVDGISQTISYTGNVAIDTYEFPYILYEETDLIVKVIDSIGNVAELILNSDYTIQLNDEYTDALVTLSTAVDDTHTINLTRVMALTQPYDFTEGGSFSADTFEQSLDRLLLLIQQINQISVQVLQIPTGSSLATQLPTAKANALLGTNSDGTAWQFVIPDSSFIYINSNPPSASDDYSLWFDSSNRQLRFWDGNQWAPVGGADSNKVDKIVTNYTPGNLIVISQDGGIEDSQTSVEDFTQLINNPNLHAHLVSLSQQPALKGSIIIMDGQGVSSLPVGDDGQILVADSSIPKGITWRASSLDSPDQNIAAVELIAAFDNPNGTNELTFNFDPKTYSKLELIGSNIQPNETGNTTLAVRFGYGMTKGNYTIPDDFMKVRYTSETFTNTINEGSSIDPFTLTRGAYDVTDLGFMVEIANLMNAGPLLFKSFTTYRHGSSGADGNFSAKGHSRVDQEGNYLVNIRLRWVNNKLFNTSNGHIRLYGWRL